MQRGEVYHELARVLAEAEREPRELLVARIGAPPRVADLLIDSEPVRIELRVEWLDRAKGTLRVSATADGPSWWKLERMEESIVVGGPRAASGELAP